jgi:hypothetical protein
MLAASLTDLDGLGIIVSEDLYWDLHHKLGHCLLFGVVMSAALMLLWSRRRAWVMLVYLALFHAHLGMDLLGSGENWTIWYLWPFSSMELEYQGAWPLYSWQNITAAGALVLWTAWIAIHRSRTPLELPMPTLDCKLVACLQRLRRGPGVTAPNP